MISLTLGKISITSIGRSSGVFMGDKNKLKKFCSDQIINEVVGTLSGHENTVSDNKWIKDKQPRKDE